jgi:ribosome-associated protein
LAISPDVAEAIDPDRLVEVVLATLDDGKAEDVSTIDLRGRSAFADHMVIATGRSQRQLAALADHLEQKLKELGLFSAVEGLPQGDWVLIDAGDIIVHLFRPEVRSFYNLERMWGVPEPQAAAGVGA